MHNHQAMLQQYQHQKEQYPSSQWFARRLVSDLTELLAAYSAYHGSDSTTVDDEQNNETDSKESNEDHFENVG